jgi:hypothetical protein
MIPASPDGSVSVIQILDDADVASASPARNCGPFYPRQLCSWTNRTASTDELRAAILCFDNLASGHRTHGWATRAAGYRAAISCVGTFATCRLPPECPLIGVHRMCTVDGQNVAFDPPQKSRPWSHGAGRSAHGSSPAEPPPSIDQAINSPFSQKNAGSRLKCQLYSAPERAAFGSQQFRPDWR